MKKTPQAGVVAAAVIGMVLAVWPWHPVTAQDSQLIERGRQVFLNAGDVGCAACHGTYAEGDVGIGPYNRGVGESSVREALDSVDEMSFLKDALSDDEIRQIAAYYEWLGQMQLVKVLVKRGRFVPDEIDIHPGTAIQLVIDNSGRASQTFGSDDMGIEAFEVPGRTVEDLIWTAPNDEGVFELRCTDCRLKNQAFSINVTRAARPFPPTLQVAAVDVELVPIPAEQRDPGLIAQGRDVFLNAAGVGCVACHGPYAEGDVGIGPYNRGFDEERIRQALATVDAMAFLGDALTDEEISQVAAYYQRLGELHLVKTRVIRGRFIPDRIRVAPGTKVQFVVNNTSQEDRTFASGDMGIEDFHIPGRQAADFVWVAPSADGDFSLTCTDCVEPDQRLTIQVSQVDQ